MPKDKFEAQLKEMQLQQTLKQKQELEHKLKQLEENISVLTATSPPGTTKPGQPPLSSAARQNLKADWARKAQEAEDFARRMRDVQRAIHRRENQLRQSETLEKKQDPLPEDTNSEEKAKERLNLEEDRAERRRDRVRLLEFARSVPARKDYLYQKMHQQFVETVELPELERRKQSIAEKRNLYRPIRRAELELNQKSHDEFIRKTEEERIKRREQFVRDQAKYFERVDKEYKSVFTDEVLKEQEEKRRLQKEAEEAQREKCERMRQYAQVVKENFVPEPSPVKAQELRHMIEKLTHKEKPKKKETILQNLTAKTPTVVRSATRSPETMNLTLGEKEAAKPKPMLKIEKKAKSGAKETKYKLKKNRSDFVKIDYLSEVRKSLPKRMDAEDFDYEKVIKDETLPVEKKFELVEAHANHLTENARKKETIPTAKRTAKMCEDVAEMYLSAIREKLFLIDGL